MVPKNYVVPIIFILFNLGFIEGRRSRDITTQIDKTPFNQIESDRSFKDEVPSEFTKSNKTEPEFNIMNYGVKSMLHMARGKKNQGIERIVPLFILPFLIQSAIIPFIVQSIKLLVLKSLLVGKAALLFFAISMLKNAGKSQRSVPYYLKEVPAYERPDDVSFPHYAGEAAHPTVPVTAEHGPTGFMPINHHQHQS